MTPTSSPLDAITPLDPDRAQRREQAAATVDYFVFRLCGRAYALPPGSVELVAPAQTIVPVPTVPAHVRGVVHLRGRIIAVIDLAGALGVDGADAAVPGEARLVVMASRAHPFAFVADATLGIWAIAEGALIAGTDDGPIVHGRIEGPAGAATVIDPTVLLERVLGARGAAA